MIYEILSYRRRLKEVFVNTLFVRLAIESV